ncbi:MAG: hypothetical protein KQJ78_25260 [Deltaproteobacteria bacterium]|nr:hypothetical protein [Deltaproteobacteria bacterium]
MPRASKLLAVLAFLVSSSLTAGAQAATFNVTNEAQLTTALATAAANGENNIINLAAGTYNLTATATFNTATSGRSLVVQGAGGLAVLDGGGTKRVAAFGATGGWYNFTFRNLRFQNGGVEASGVGLLVEMSGGNNQAMIDHCGFINNTSTAAIGIGGSLDGDSVVVTHSIFQGNTLSAPATAGMGGGLFLSTTPQGYAKVDNCLFVDNDAGALNGFGGGLYATGTGQVFLLNNTFVGNAATAGGGAIVSVDDGTWMPEIYNNVLRGNTSLTPGTNDLYVAVTFGGPFTSVLLWNNILGDYSDSEGTLFSEQDNLNQDPQLDAGYRPTATSPGRDAGYNAATAYPFTDLADQPRVQNGVVDIGAYEYPVGTLALTTNLLTPSTTPGQSPAAQSFLMQNTGGAAVNYTVTDNVAWLTVSPASGNLAGLTNQSVTVTYDTTGLAPGAYAAVITVTDTTPVTGQAQQIQVNLTVSAGINVGMRRLYDPYSGRHLFTISGSEAAALAALGWQDESSPQPFYVSTSELVGSRPVYRLYNPNTGAHYLTLRAGERTALLAQGWQAERNQGYMFPTPVTGTSEVYTLYHTVLGDHLYTANPNELAWIVTNLPVWVQQSSLGHAFRSLPN